MKKLSAILIFVGAICLISLTTSSCNRGTGCPMNENAHVQPNKKGKYPKAKTRSGLFPKGMKSKSR